MNISFALPPSLPPSLPFNHILSTVGASTARPVAPEAILTGHEEMVVCVDVSASLDLVVSAAKCEPFHLFVCLLLVCYVSIHSFEVELASRTCM